MSKFNGQIQRHDQIFFAVLGKKVVSALREGLVWGKGMNTAHGLSVHAREQLTNSLKERGLPYLCYDHISTWHIN